MEIKLVTLYFIISTNMKQNMNSEFDNVTLSELEHEDSTVTILSTFNNTGLQVRYVLLIFDVRRFRIYIA